MAVDRSLTTLLRALQSVPDEEDTSRLLELGTGLLTRLSNPLNVTLLTAQLLSAPAIWLHADGLRSTIRILSIFTNACNTPQSAHRPSPVNHGTPTPRELTKEEWVTAVIEGADDRSPRWRHVLAFGGLLLGFSGKKGYRPSGHIQGAVQNALVRAINITLQESEFGDGLAGKSVAVALSHTFDFLNDVQKASLDHRLLLPMLYRAPLFDQEGLHSGYFLSIIDADVLENAPGKFDWSTQSSTFVRMQRMASGPLVASLGPLSRLIAYSAENVQDLDLLAVMVEDVFAFTRSLCVQWRQNKLSEVDLTDEKTFLSEQTLKDTLPLLWRVLRSSMFAIVVILRAVLGRVLGDARVSTDTGLFIATQTLHILRNLYFISSRLGANAFSQYNFVNLAAVDIVSQYPVQAEAFLREIGPSGIASIPDHPLDRCHDLYFLNSAEHYAFVLGPQISENLLIPASQLYLGLGGDQRLLELFEAAHSVMLAVFAAPQNTGLVLKHLDAYFDTLSQVFPRNLSPRQFRMAVKTLIRVITPPSPICEAQPLLASTLLEIIHYRTMNASTEPSLQLDSGAASNSQADQQHAISEQAVLVLTLTDTLPFLPAVELEEWLPVVAQSIRDVVNEQMQRLCRQRLWEILTNGEMDIDRSALCVAWWSTRGGREMVLDSQNWDNEGNYMSGRLGGGSKL